MDLAAKREKRNLRLVSDEPSRDPRLNQLPWPVDLRAAPYRPGELPESLRLELDDAHIKLAGHRAAAEGLPVALWMRMAIEVGRARNVLAETTGRSTREIEELLPRSAEASRRIAGISPLARYGSAILDGGAADEPREGAGIEVLIPSEMSLAWRTAAAAAGSGLEGWAAAMIARAPEGIGRLEADAAAAGESLAAWCYAAWLACAESRSASAQPRT